MKTLRSLKHFTVVEVVVVLTVISILVSLIMSASSSIRETGKKTTCLNNLKQIQVYFETYVKNNNNKISVSLDDLGIHTDTLDWPGDGFGSDGKSYFYDPDKLIVFSSRFSDGSVNIIYLNR